ncbi:hypothetical protein M426DRAFT_173372 [Hypoxylon sp. CI-4A]|nr:hypothetical protein M426DRAFT_173372 [Hypoxylon sp. CI-4A]
MRVRQTVVVTGGKLGRGNFKSQTIVVYCIPTCLLAIRPDIRDLGLQRLRMSGLIVAMSVSSIVTHLLWSRLTCPLPMKLDIGPLKADVASLKPDNAINFLLTTIQRCTNVIYHHNSSILAIRDNISWEETVSPYARARNELDK